MSKYETQYIRDEREVPAGYVALVDFTDHKRLSSAHAKGLIRAVKMMRSPKDHRSGKVWVHQRDAAEFLAGYDSAKSEPKSTGKRDFSASNSQVEAGVIALCEISNSLTLACDLLERLTLAVESIATQSRQTEDQMRREIMTACESANGFHN